MKNSRFHFIYLAVIILLVIFITVLITKIIKANNVLNNVQNIFGIDKNTHISEPRPEPLRNLSKSELIKEKTFEEYRDEVDNIIKRAIDLNEFGKDTKLSRGCAYALSDGKRLRSIIVLEMARCLNLKKSDSHNLVDASEAALVIEYLHNASLIMDDLPEFDDDDFRRGRKSLHTEFDKATANLAGISLLTAAFQNICRQIDWIRDNCPEVRNVDKIGTCLFSEISHALGANGASGGQYMDISSKEDLFNEFGSDNMFELMQKKTATFFEISFISGWIVGGGDMDKIDEIRKAGSNFGIAFQIADDIGDMKKDSLQQIKGKPAWNFANKYGVDSAKKEVEIHLDTCKSILKKFDMYTNVWVDIYNRVWGMAVIDSSKKSNTENNTESDTEINTESDTEINTESNTESDTKDNTE